MKKITLYLVLLVVSSLSNAQNLPDTVFSFTTIKENKITPVKNQASSGTCWSFSGIGFYEAELLRLGKPEIDLSEMFVVYHSYIDKAERYVRMYGNTHFAGGGAFYDVTYVLKNYGIAPNSVMDGLKYGEEKHRHAELDAVLLAFVKAIASNPNKKVSTAWKPAYRGILDAYFGVYPTEFTVDGKKYTPKTYAESLGLNFDDYVSLTSFTHHPYYTKFAIEVPDNWRNDESYNLPLDEFMQVLDYAINNGYTVAWASDVSESAFTRTGIAVVPDKTIKDETSSDQTRLIGSNPREKENITGPVPEMTITQEMRQEGFDNYETTDDHGMLIYGVAQDQNGARYYMVKNSWGVSSPYKGIWYVSVPFTQYKTLSIVVHKDVLSKELKNKLGIK